MSSYNADSLDRLSKQFDRDELGKMLNDIMLDYSRIALLTSSEDVDHKKVASHLQDLATVKNSLCDNDNQL